MDPRLKEVRRRLKDDFPFYAAKALKIRTKELEIKPLILNDAQILLQAAIDKQVQAGLPVRIIILKGRQQGLSTHVGGYLFFSVSQQKAAKALVVAHKSDSTQTLFDMTKRYYEHCPEILRPSTKYSTKRELVFDKLDSSYAVATAGGEGIARGETISHLHASELAFWAPATARENWNGLRQTVPDAPGTAIFIESTAHGMSGVFYELWQEAVEGRNGYIPVFIPWFLQREYRKEVSPNFELTPMEIDLAARFGLDNEQLCWRRQKVAENGLDLFRQEYPCFPEEAFLASGRPVFNPDAIYEFIEKAPGSALERKALEGQTFEDHPRGELAVYTAYDPAEEYVIGADVGKGIRHGDYSVACVLDSQKRQIAVWRGHVHPDYFAIILYHLGIFYNQARLIVENNDHGILTCHLLAKEEGLAYPNLYTEVQHDKIEDRDTVKTGFTTNAKTKPLIIDKLRQAIREHDIEIVDKVTLQEMLTYIFTESGRMEAEADCHDDCVIALALANYVHEGPANPILNKDKHYIEMI